MKKLIRSCIICLLSISCLLSTASAQTYSMNPQVQSTEIIWIDNESCIEVVTFVSTSPLLASSKHAEKVYTLKASGATVVSYTLEGWFNYDGKTSKAIDVSSSFDIYQPGWDVSDHEESYSGNTVRGTAVFSGPSGDKTIRGSITCDKNGNIS